MSGSTICCLSSHAILIQAVRVMHVTQEVGEMQGLDDQVEMGRFLGWEDIQTLLVRWFQYEAIDTNV